MVSEGLAENFAHICMEKISRTWVKKNKYEDA